MRLFVLLMTFLSLLAVLAGCSSSAKGTLPTPSLAPSASPMSLDPPTFTLAANSGKQRANTGAFYWQRQDNGLAAEIHAPGIPVQEKPLVVKRGEQLRNAVGNGPAPDSIELKAYPKDGNHKPISTANNAIDAFVPTTDPVITTTLGAGADTWTAELEPGEYFVWMKGTWPNPILPTRSRTVEYSFLIHVQ